MSIAATFRRRSEYSAAHRQAAPGRPLIPPVPPPKRHPYDQWSPDARALDLVGDKWTLLIIRDLAAGPRRFVELQRVLPGISTEQLRSRLNRMVADGLLTRQRYREVPPRVDYELTERSRELMPVLGALARWGYDWTWSAPRPGEDVNVGAIFRLAPGHARAAAPGSRARSSWSSRPRASARAPVPRDARGRPRGDLRGRRSAADGDGARHRRRPGCARSARRARPKRCRSRAATAWPAPCSTASRSSACSVAAASVVRRSRRASPRSDLAARSSEVLRRRPRRARPCRAMSDRGPR